MKAAIYQLSNQVSNTCAPFRSENAQWRKVEGLSGEKQGGNVLHVIQLKIEDSISSIQVILSWYRNINVLRLLIGEDLKKNEI